MRPYEIYFVSDSEMEMLENFGNVDIKDPTRYDAITDVEELRALCRIKDKGIKLWQTRCFAARNVIDTIAEEMGFETPRIDFYTPAAGGVCPLLVRMKEWVSRGGEKTRLKKKVQELEKENALLRSLFQKNAE